MTLTCDRETAQVLREILGSALRELRVESARADVHDFREQLHRRERVVEGMLAQLEPDANRSARTPGPT